MFESFVEKGLREPGGFADETGGGLGGKGV